jgi:predicted metal-dependent peptidase
MITVKLSPQDKLAAARLWLVERAPYFFSGILNLIPREMPGLGTCGVTKDWKLLWDPQFVDTLTVEQVGWVLLHELFHRLRQHAERAEEQGKDGRWFNIASDMEINDDFDPKTWSMPAGVLLPQDRGWPVGLTAEEYYARLQAEQQDDGGKDDGEGEDKDSDGEGESPASPGKVNPSPGKSQPSQPGNGPSDGKGSSQPGQPGPAPKGPGQGHCGSGAGNPLPTEPPADGDGRSDTEQRRVIQQVAQDIVQAAAQKGRGTMPGGWLAWAEEQVKPAKVPWRQMLARLVRGSCAYRAGQADLTHTKLSRRQAGVGYGPGRPVMCAWHAPTPRVAVGLDTSGSMGYGEGSPLAAGLAEIAGVLRAVQADVEFLACDAAVHAIKKVRSFRELLPEVKGGGGTDFRPIFEAIEARRPRPDIFVFVTDGQGPAPEVQPPGVETIWVLVGKYRTRPCEWGKMVEVDDD